MNTPAPESSEITSNGHVFVKTTYLGISVLIDKETGFYSGTKICKDNGKKINDLTRFEHWKDMLEAVSSTARIPAVELSKEITVVSNGFRGTYVHPLLVNYVAQWANKKYAVKIAMLLNTINERIILEKRTLEDEIESEKYLIEELKGKNNSLTKEVADLKREIREMREENDYLINLSISANYKLDEIKDDTNAIRQATDVVLDEIDAIPVKMKRMGKAHDILSIYFSESKPKDNNKRNAIRDDEIWLGTFVGQEANKRRSIPEDAEEIYSSDFNGLDSFLDVLDNEEIRRFVHRVHQRSILVSENELEQFINVLDRYLNQTGNYNSVVQLRRILARIENKHRENGLVVKKRQILETNPNLHIAINGWKRKVYSFVQGRLAAPTPETPWYYRFGKDGMSKAEINEKMIDRVAFVNESDKRIKYEH